jgi:hypothetical protein
MRVIVVDDLRFFSNLDAVYHRTLDDALAWWATYRQAPEPIELWLDHDLGGAIGDEDVRPLVRAIEEHLATVGALPIKVRLVTDNPVGRRWIRQALERYVPVVDSAPPFVEVNLEEG